MNVDLDIFTIIEYFSILFYQFYFFVKVIKYLVLMLSMMNHIYNAFIIHFSLLIYSPMHAPESDYYRNM